MSGETRAFVTSEGHWLRCISAENVCGIRCCLSQEGCKTNLYPFWFIWQKWKLEWKEKNPLTSRALYLICWQWEQNIKCTAHCNQLVMEGNTLICSVCVSELCQGPLDPQQNPLVSFKHPWDAHTDPSGTPQGLLNPLTKLHLQKCCKPFCNTFQDFKHKDFETPRWFLERCIRHLKYAPLEKDSPYPQGLLKHLLGTLDLL